MGEAVHTYFLSRVEFVTFKIAQQNIQLLLMNVIPPVIVLS